MGLGPIFSSRIFLLDRVPSALSILPTGSGQVQPLYRIIEESWSLFTQDFKVLKIYEEIQSIRLLNNIKYMHHLLIV